MASFMKLGSFINGRYKAPLKGFGVDIKEAWS